MNGVRAFRRARRADLGGPALVLTGALLPLLWATAPLEGQATASPYTTAQADQGQAVYRASCSVCHRADFSGSFEAPELAGPNFRNTWGPAPALRAARVDIEHDAARRGRHDEPTGNDRRARVYPTC
jgi:mono/diheme cytochrome c family protein